MATTVPEPPKIDVRLPEHSGNGGWRNLVPANGDLRITQDYSPPPSSTAIWVVIFGVTMMFAAFSSALIVSKGGARYWQNFTLPWILYFNTLVLIASSVTLEIARRRFSAGYIAFAASHIEGFSRWLYTTLCLGLLFVLGQYEAWRQLRAEGLYLATNPSSSYFYLLTAVHAIHVLGGLGGMLYVLRKMSKSALRPNQIIATTRYWHFMGVLWIYLLSLLWITI
jgi:cytochrome c oxidase subunit III